MFYKIVHFHTNIIIEQKYKGNKEQKLCGEVIIPNKENKKEKRLTYTPFTLVCYRNLIIKHTFARAHFIYTGDHRNMS